MNNEGKTMGKGPTLLSKKLVEHNQMRAFTNSAVDAILTGDVTQEIDIDLEEDAMFIPRKSAKHRVPKKFSTKNPTQKDYNDDFAHHFLPAYYEAIPGTSQNTDPSFNNGQKNTSTQPDMKLYGKIKERLFSLYFVYLVFWYKIFRYFGKKSFTLKVYKFTLSILDWERNLLAFMKSSK